jgi:hypothetical protein
MENAINRASRVGDRDLPMNAAPQNPAPVMDTSDAPGRQQPIDEHGFPAAASDPGGPTLSFVIPAFNEEKLISRTIEAIHRLVPPISYEIVVVDNGSADATPRIAAELGATVIRQPGGTIGALRNRGVRASHGDTLVFLDADVVLTPEWAARIPASLEMLREEPAALTGYMCTVPADASWLERYWFAPRQKASHIGSGHMVISRSFFDALEGFDESLATGEDYDLSRRGVALGGQIVADQRLKVEHLGFPRTIWAFLQREAWHGVGDYKSFAVFVRSKVAVIAAGFAVLHAVLLTGLLVGSLSTAAIAALTIVGVCLASSYRQYRGQPLHVVLLNAGVFWVYYLGRTLALIRRVAGQYARGSR